MYLDFKQTEIIIEKQHFNEKERKKCATQNSHYLHAHII